MEGEVLSIAMLTTFWLALPRIGLPDSLESLSTFANQLQTVVSAAIAHPLFAVIIVVFSIGLIQLIADLVKRIIRSTLTFVLTLPLTLSQWIWKKVTAHSAADPSLKGVTSRTGQINQLIERLEALRTEQDQIMTELKDMLGHAESSRVSTLNSTDTLSTTQEEQQEEKQQEEKQPT